MMHNDLSVNVMMHNDLSVNAMMHNDLSVNVMCHYRRHETLNKSVCYNDLPHDIQMSQSLDTFKYNLRYHMMSIN